MRVTSLGAAARGGSMLLLAIIAACTGGSSGDTTAPGATYTSKFLINTLTLPQRSSDFAIDLNGDGRVDNAFGGVIGALTGQGIAMQPSVDAAIASGKVEHLLSVTSHDSTLGTDAAAGASLSLAAQGGAFPGPYSVDGSVTPATFTGSIAGGTFTATNPVTTHSPVDATLRLDLFAGTPLTLNLHGASVRFTRQAGSPMGLSAGQIDGSISATDVQTKLIPWLAASFTAIIQADTSSTTSKQLEQLFDVGGCTGAVANDYNVNACELAGSSIIQALLAPDVQIFDASGNYAPSSANTTPNALSFGIGFTAVATTY